MPAAPHPSDPLDVFKARMAEIEAEQEAQIDRISAVQRAQSARAKAEIRRASGAVGRLTKCMSESKARFSLTEFANADGNGNGTGEQGEEDEDQGLVLPEGGVVDSDAEG